MLDPQPDHAHVVDLPVARSRFVHDVAVRAQTGARQDSSLNQTLNSRMSRLTADLNPLQDVTRLAKPASKRRLLVLFYLYPSLNAPGKLKKLGMV